MNYEEISEILQKDDRDQLEIEVSRYRNDLSAFLRPQNKNKSTIFHLAIEFKARQCMNLLLEKNGPNTSHLDAPDINGWTPLHLSINNATEKPNAYFLNFAELLLQHGSYINCRNVNGDAPVHLLIENITQLQNLNSNNCMKLLDRILSDENIDVDAVNGLMQTPLRKLLALCSENNQLLLFTACERLVSKGASFDAVDKSVLHQLKIESPSKRIVAPELWHANFVNQIIGQSFNKDALNVEKESIQFYNRYIGTKSVLYHLVEACKDHEVELLLQFGLNPWLENIENDNIPLHAALVRGHIGMVNLLLDYMASSRTGTIDLSTKTFTLMQAVLCNAPTDEALSEYARESSAPVKATPGPANHTECLRALLSNDIKLNLYQKNVKNDCSVQQLFSWLSNTAMGNIIHEKDIWEPTETPHANGELNLKLNTFWKLNRTFVS